MNKDELIALREQLLAEITPLVIENVGDGADRFSLLLRIIQSGHATEDIYTKAFKSAHAIEDTAEKLDALMALLDEVEVDLDRDLDRDEYDDFDEPAEAPNPAPVQIPVQAAEMPVLQSEPQQQEHHEQN